MFEERKFIGEYLCEKGIITKDQLKKAMAEHKRTNQRIGDILIKNGWASEDDLAKALSEQLGFAFIDVSTYQVDEVVVHKIPVNMAERLLAIPIYKIANSLTVAMADPLNVAAIDELQRVTGLNVNPVFATKSAIEEVIGKYYHTGKKDDAPKAGGKAEAKGVSDSFFEEDDPKLGKTKPDMPKLIEEATQGPVIDLVNKIIGDAVAMKASDIHLEPQEETFYCRYRVDGMLQNFKELPKDSQSAVLSRVKIMGDIDITERRLPQDGRTQVTVGGKEVDLRIATFPTIHGEHVAIRILDKSGGILALEELGLDGALLKQFRSVVTKPHGLILVTGPTGSGKSTTLYSVLNSIRDSEKNIITLEDPVEYSIENIHQSQVNIRAGLTFANGLRSIVRLDPDVIMIGEIRDKETAEIAVRAALTGHLVFSTVHTNDSASTFTRMIDIGVEPFLISSSVKAVLAQRLVRKLCDKCKKEYSASAVDAKRFDLPGKAKIYEPGGCNECHNTGYNGRTGIYELLVPSDEVRSFVAKKASTLEISNQLKSEGVKTLLEDGVDKVKQGVTSLSEILRVSEEA